MTAPSAAPLPPSRLPSPVRPSSTRPLRCLGWLAATALLASAASGCVTVHGETALIPSASKADARRALDRYVRVSNEAGTRLDASLDAQSETGALGSIDSAQIRIDHAREPAGDPGYPPLALSGTRFLIPRQRGWPKWFVTDSADNRDGNRWVLVFVRYAADQPWRASYLLTFSPGQLPGFATDPEGYVEPVPVTGSDLIVQPGELGPRYAAYLQQEGTGRTPFAAGRFTSQVVAARHGASDPQVVTQYADQGADPERDAPVALRLADGGALVFFSTDHQIKQTVAEGRMTDIDQSARALMTGTPNTSVTLFEVGEQVATVPAAGSGGSGQVTLLGRAVGPVAAHGA